MERSAGAAHMGNHQGRDIEGSKGKGSKKDHAAVAEGETTSSQQQLAQDLEKVSSQTVLPEGVEVAKFLAVQPENTEEDWEHAMERAPTFNKGLVAGANAFQALAAQIDDEVLQAKRKRFKQERVQAILLDTHPDVASMRGQRGEKTVVQMVQAWCKVGLFMMGDQNSPINQAIVPAAQYILQEIDQLDPKNSTRRMVVRSLADCCMDCQQVQARVILRIYSDFICQTRDLRSQVLYFLSKYKEEAIDTHISLCHSEADLDHTKTQPFKQRAHLWSGYLDLLGPQYGVEAALTSRGDRFLQQALAEIAAKNPVERAEIEWNCMACTFLNEPAATQCAICGTPSGAGDLASSIFEQIVPHIDWVRFARDLRADINNQSAGADRLISQACFHRWAMEEAQAQGLDPHLIFYDEDRANEFEESERPKAENEYQPFLSKRVMEIILVDCLQILSY